MKKQDYFGRSRGRRLKGAKKKKEEIKGFKFKEKSGIYSRILLTRGKKLAAHAAGAKGAKIIMNIKVKQYFSK